MVTLTSDFGFGSPYVAAMKAVLIRAGVQAPLIDIDHDLAPFDIRAAAFVLWAATRDFAGLPSVHLAVVDPGVGGDRRALALDFGDGRRYVGPDNGLMEFVLRHADRPVRAVELPVPAGAAPTFHGRDVFAPAGAALASGTPLDRLGAFCGELVRLHRDEPQVLWVDRFGNIVTSLRALPAELEVAGHRVRQVHRTFADAAPGVPFLYLGSLGYVEVGLRDASAATQLGVVVGSVVAARG
ncbi:MAG: SAM-dependent chlorinase/fluorinase [Candidatus Dormibacteraeota bacterium]|uniref:SAM-dependent chlorinase/fluorinase n=1 Tax=Candidatus Dormiibacter inghamiae TaxID=3127013 RepID=A0A934K771_9BACT|nr:SAM-dependent chlorinase/fluorinase [Candidatus Dormibacteraeota bacterium]MBJ7607745.1 SAM-dependent chlorinase/fluorinase [Candidatus Dormibacteraeota bacterium]